AGDGRHRAVRGDPRRPEPARGAEPGRAHAGARAVGPAPGAARLRRADPLALRPLEARPRPRARRRPRPRPRRRRSRPRRRRRAVGRRLLLTARVGRAGRARMPGRAARCNGPTARPGGRAGGPGRPLLEGEEAEAARAARDAVVAELARLQPDPIGLDGGWAGLALVHGALARGGDEEALDRCADCLERAFDQLGEVRSPWLVDGVAGVAWVAGHLADLIDIEEDTLAELDGLCARLLARDRWTGAWEHLYGLVGLALPAVDGRSPAAERARADALRHLAAGAERPGDGLTWRAPPEMLASGDERAANPGGYHDLGMAHGACGIAALLARAGGEASELLEGAVRWLRARDGGDPAGRFPLRLGASLASRRQLDGWCYGDQAAGAALVAAGGAAGRA